jgi:predicted lipid-binding transport protein (Tim44 family)|tara:strand:+ start:540 stop:1160 length:621 start_codon:yes stop_codon:yes gene_type:complete
MYIYQIMSNNFGFIDIILLAMIAGFIILRLRNILGRKTGHDGKVVNIYDEKKFEKFKTEIKPKTVNQDNLVGKDKEQFLKGAEIAYETIITAFAKGEKKKLAKLLTKEMISNFDQAIDERNKEKIKSELTFIGIKESKIEKFEKINNDLFATVRFVCEIISVKKDKTDKIIEGDPDKIKVVIDHWKFSKNIQNNSPNWYLVEITNK